MSNNYTFIQNVRNNNINYVKKLLTYKTDPTFNNNEAIRIASKNGFLELTKLLLIHPKVDSSDYKNEAIINASKNGHSADNNFAIKKASLKGYTEIVNLLLQDKRVDIYVDNNYAINNAYINNHKHVVTLLQEKGAVINSSNIKSQPLTFRKKVHKFFRKMFSF